MKSRPRPSRVASGYINKAAHEVGVLLEPAVAGGLFAEFESSKVSTSRRSVSAAPPKGASMKAPERRVRLLDTTG